MCRLPSLLLAWGLAVASGSALAQVTVAAPSAALRCLTRGELPLGSPAYPKEAYRLKVAATVEIELEFSAPDARPTVGRLKVQPANVDFDQEFEAAVRDFVRDYRVPCVAVGERARLRQEFSFVPTDGRPIALMAADSPDDFDFNAMGCPFDDSTSRGRSGARDGARRFLPLHWAHAAAGA